MSVTIKDVAKKAGVSHTTVSMVIHDDPRITPDTRKKVMKAIKELKYYPNILARGLVRGKTNTIAVVANFFSSPFEIGIMKGIESIIDNYPYNVNQYATRAKRDKRKDILQNIVYGKMADAVIILSKKPEKSMMAEFKSRNMPVILVEEEMEGAHSLKTDSFKGAYKATEYLIKKGKKGIGLVVGEVKNTELGLSPADRLAGYKKALKDNSVQYDEKNVIQIRDFYFEEGIRALRKFIDSKRKIDSVFSAAGDSVAMGIIKEAHVRNIKIPDELSVVGFDDIETASIINPPLTTIRQPIQEIGMQAYKIAVDAVEGRLDTEKTMLFEPELIVRRSA